ncbi:MAG: MaoC/PaaZ C-terminal domain-containing protein [Rubrivivax sp.]
MHLDHVIARPFPPTEQAWDERDSVLYALALGFGQNPLDEAELPFVYEGRGGVRAVPTFAATLAWTPFWQHDPATGIAWVRIVHGEEHIRWHRPLPAQGRVVGRHRLLAVEDKGAGRGALIHFETALEDAAGGAPLASVRQVQFLRSDGGCGAWGEAPPPAAALPDDLRLIETVDLPTLPQAALLYRQASRDLMPIHADPEVARRAGFERPISHGLNTMGLAMRAIVRRHAPERVRALSVRFAAPGLPGDTVRVSLFEASDGVCFKAHALERGVPLLDRGHCELA